MRLRFLFVFIILLASFPLFAYAQGHASGGIVPNCGGFVNGVFKDCSFGDLLTLGGNILNYIVMLSITISAFMFAYAGFLYFSSGGNEKNVSTAHTIFTSVAIGLVIILVAWLIVNTLLVTLTGEGLNSRSQKVQSQSSVSQTRSYGPQ